MKFKNRLAAGALALGIGATAALGTTVTAGEASARVASGKYTWYDRAIVPAIPAQATIRGNWITIHTPGVPQRYRIHSTRTGGYFDIPPMRYVLNRHGRTYSGPAYYGPVRLGHSTLVPRR